MVAPLLLATAAPAAAQGPTAVRVAADNDAFNFWLPPWDRPDREYTSGARGTLEYAGRPGWPVWPRLSRDASRVSSHSFSIGQAIYTGVREPNIFARPNDWQDDGQHRVRPNAGWLYVEAAERDSTARATTELAVAVGVVGPPALAEQMQRFFHSLGPEFQRPVDWTRQLPFEPGFVARYLRTSTVGTFGDANRWRGAFTTELGGSAGTILTALSAGAGVATDVALGGAPASATAPHLAFTAGFSGQFVLRDEFLDGTIFRTSDRVDKQPIVTEARFALTFRWRQLGVTYRATHSGRQYDGQGPAASWGTIQTEWRFGR